MVGKLTRSSSAASRSFSSCPFGSCIGFDLDGFGTGAASYRQPRTGSTNPVPCEAAVLDSLGNNRQECPQIRLVECASTCVRPRASEIPTRLCQPVLRKGYQSLARRTTGISRQP